MSETRLTRKLCRLIERQGAMTYPLIGGRNTPPHWPDRMVVWDPHGPAFFEAKVGANWLDDGQQERCEQLVMQGAIVRVATLFEDERFSMRKVNGDVICILQSWSGFLRALYCVSGQDFSPLG